ncbi:MAG: GldG family protein [Oscillospiraceae bacterium]|nr:GldG family protein [Oscillospiraceae bacterium]
MDNRYIGKKLKYGTQSTVIIVIVIAIVVILNVIVSMLMQRSALKVDLTSNKMYAISAETEDYVKGLNTEVKIIVCGNELDLRNNSYYNYIVNLLDKYASFNDKVSVEYVDIVDEPEKISKYIEMGSTDIAEGSIIVTSGNKIRVNSIDNLINFENNYATGSVTPVSLNVEGVITPNILYVTNANPKRVAVCSSNYSSYAQAAISSLMQLMYDNAYEFKYDENDKLVNIDLNTMELNPEEYDLVILAAPTVDYGLTAIEKINNYLLNGGQYGKNVIYLADFKQPTLPNIEAFLASWGMRVERSLIEEKDETLAQSVQIAIASQPVACPIGNVVAETYKIDAAKPVVLPGSRPITLLWAENDNYVTESILQNSGTAVTNSLSDGALVQQSGSPKISVALSTRRISDSTGYTENYSKVMVFGTANLADPYVLANKSYANNEFMINAINTLVGKEDSGFTYVSKNFATDGITVSTKAKNNIRNFLLIVVPAIVIAGGVIVFIRRRNR